MAFSNLPIWSEEEIDEREDGFLLMRNGWEEEDQPLLLHSTKVVLETLYPSMDLNSIFNGEGHMGSSEPLLSINEVPDGESVSDEHPSDNAEPSGTNSGKGNDNDVRSHCTPYQHLIRNDKLNNRMESAVIDIQRCRHRVTRNQHDRSRMSREDQKVRALEHQQRILHKQESNSESSEEENAKDNDGDEETPQTDPDLIRLVRTLNSIRALYPHLLPILNHPRRNDRTLRIKKTGWKQKKKPMCWTLGKETFDITSVKHCKNTHMDVTLILKGYIDVSLADKISNDGLGAPDFWQNNWICELKKRISPDIVNPMEILSQHRDIASIETVARQCDNDLLSNDVDEAASDIQEKYRQTINQLQERILWLLQKRFPSARLSIYGSCQSNLSLGVGADVDLSLWIPEAEKMKNGFEQGVINARIYERDMKKLVYNIFHLLRKKDREFANMQPITRARVPVVKGTKLRAGNPYSPDGSINFDICFLNDIAVANSDLLREYSLVDCRARSLMMAVKRWTKDNKINSAKDNTISSYAWINLCIFYMQCIGFVPNLQSRHLMQDLSVIPDPEGNYWHSVNKLDTMTLRWDQLEERNAWKQPSEYRTTPVSVLLYGFFEFYSRRFPLALFSASIKHGTICLPKLASPKLSMFYSIEDPFETYDSHCPHDLGTPASDGGARKIIQKLEDGEQHVKEILLGNSNSPDRMWPVPDSLEAATPTSKFQNGKPKFQNGKPKAKGPQSTGANTKSGPNSGKVGTQPQNRKKNYPSKNHGQRQNPQRRQAHNEQNESEVKSQTKPDGGAKAPESKHKGNKSNSQDDETKGKGGKKGTSQRQNPQRRQAQNEQNGAKVKSQTKPGGGAKAPESKHKGNKPGNSQDDETKGKGGEKGTSPNRQQRNNRKYRRGKQAGSPKGSASNANVEVGK